MFEGVITTIKGLFDLKLIVALAIILLLLQLCDYPSYATSKNVVIVIILWEASTVYSGINPIGLQQFIYKI